MSRGLFLILFAIVSLSFVNAQETPRLAEQPVFLARFHGWTEQGTRRYLQDLKHDLEIGGTFLTQMDRPEAKENSGSLEDPTSGMMVYLTQGLIPSVEQISFTEVADETEFRKFVQIHKRQHGESGVLEGADEKYKLFVSRVVRVELPVEPKGDRNETDGDSGTGVEQASESDAAESDVSDREPVSVSVGIGTQGLMITETKTLSRVTEENGKRYQVDTTEDATWYRLHDGFMFTAKTEALWSMSLPSADLLREHSNSERNAVLAFYPDRIPMGLRQVAWGALNAAAGSVLQQHDDEKDDAYAMRRLPGAAGLSLTQAIMFDTQEISSWMKLATDENSLRGEFRLDARTNSNLGGSLQEFASGNSRFAALLNDDAAATVHLNVNLPNDWKEAVDALRTFGLNDAAEITSQNLASAATALIRSGCSSADHGTVESLIKVGWTQESGAVLYGGLQIDDTPEILSSILTVLSEGATPGEEWCTIIQKGDIQMLQIMIPADEMPDFLHLSHLYLVHANSCLWFAIGGENAHEIIKQSIARCNDSAGIIQTPLLSLRVDLEQWMTYPQDDATGLTMIPELACMMLEGLINDQIGGRHFRNVDGVAVAVNMTDADQGYILRTLKLAGGKELGVFVDADQSGLMVRGTVGSAVARALMAQIVMRLEAMQAVAPEVDPVPPQ